MIILRRFFNKVLKFNNWLLFGGSLVFMVISGYIFYWIEPVTFKNPFIGLWYVMTTVTTVGYGDYSPVTVAGRIYALFIYIVGIGLIGVVIGKVVDGFGEYRRRKVEGKLTYQGADHVVIIGWSRKSEIATQEILHSHPSVEIVLVDQLEESPLFKDRFHYIQGAAANDETLKQAGLDRAKASIIFADDTIEDRQLIDGKTLLIATTIEHFAPHIKTMVEIIDEQNVKNFRYVNVNEFILPEDTVSMLAVRGVFSDGILSVYNKLVSRQRGENLYLINKRDEWKTYGDAFRELLEEGATLVCDGEDLSINERLNDPIKEDSKLYVICSEMTHRKISSQQTT